VVGDVGKAGVAIDSVEDMKILFDGIPLDQMSVSMTMNGAVIPILAFFIVAGEEQGVPQAARRHDPERHPQGVHGPQHLYLSARTLDADHLGHLRYTVREMPKFNSASRSPAITCRRPGATQVQELAFTIADGGICARRGARARYRQVRRAPELLLRIGMNFFMEVAKLRAARVLWHRVMTKLGAKDERSKMLRTHCQTSGVSLQEQDPYNNVIRTTIEAMAAMLGGTQSLHTNALDEAIALPTDFSPASPATPRS
jgi:methylmalonyl-CoA mutase